MQTIHVSNLNLAGPRLLLNNTSTAGVVRSDYYNAPSAEKVPVNTVLADASHRDAMAVAATIANQLEMDRHDAVRQA
jgi:hypothetical protein